MEELQIEEWLEVLKTIEQDGKDDDNGYTTKEIATNLNISISSARELIREAIELGELKLGHRSSTRIDGRRCTIPVYDFTSAGD